MYSFMMAVDVEPVKTFQKFRSQFHKFFPVFLFCFRVGSPSADWEIVYTQYF